jgi:hypothetical protein
MLQPMENIVGMVGRHSPASIQQNIDEAVKTSSRMLPKKMTDEAGYCCFHQLATGSDRTRMGDDEVKTGDREP